MAVAVTAVVACVLQLAALLFSMGRFYNKVDALAGRITNAEKDIERWQEESAKLAAIDAKLGVMQEEISRVRTRLDRFLDGPRGAAGIIER